VRGDRKRIDWITVGAAGVIGLIVFVGLNIGGSLLAFDEGHDRSALIVALYVLSLPVGIAVAYGVYWLATGSGKD